MSHFQDEAKRKIYIFFTRGLELPSAKDMEMATSDVVVQSHGEREPNCPHGCGMDKEAPHMVKSSVLTSPRDVAVSEIHI